MIKKIFQQCAAVLCAVTVMLNYTCATALADNTLDGGDVISEAVSDERELMISEESDQPAAFTDTSTMSDGEFFGVWDDESETWSTPPKINYDYSEDLKKTERYAKLGGYGLAKESLLEYYKNRSTIAKPPLYSGSNDSFRILTMLDMYNFTEPYINSFMVDSTGDYERYEVDLKKSTANGVFMLAAREKDGDVLSILSKEGDPQKAPELVLYYTTGEVKTIPLLMDSYTRAYDDTSDYSSEVYGAEPELCVKDSWYRDENGRYLPYSGSTREAYIAFDNSKIDKNNLLTARLVIYAKLRPEDGETELTQSEKEIIVFDAYNKAWKETEASPGAYPALSWANISHNHFSWNGLPGGFDWKAPKGCSSEYVNYNMRFSQIPALLIPYMETGNEDYLYKAIDMVLDFIRDAGAGTPPNRDIEAAQRMLELIPGFFYFAESDIFNSEASTAILKYIWEEGSFLYEAPIYYDYNNRGAWHTTAFYCVVKYFPEFNDCAMWEETVNERLYNIAHVLVAEDGCYGEATFSYPNVVLGFFNRILDACEDTGTEPPPYLKEKAGKLAHYLMNLTRPNGSTPDWGEGGRALTKAPRLYDTGVLLDDEELKFWGSSGKEGTAPKKTTFRYDKLKVVSSRTNWSDSAYMMFMNAKNGGYHNHKDSLSICFWAKDREVISDTGMTSYDSKHPHFDWQRHQTKSHNTIEIDNTAQRGTTSTLDAEVNGDSAIEVYPSSEADRINSWTDATLGFRHYRNVTFMKKLKFLIVSDMVHPLVKADKMHTYTQNWHTRIKSYPEIDSDTLQGTTNFNGGANVKILQANKDNMTAYLETGYDSDGQSTTNYFCYKKYQTGDAAYDTVLFPVEEGNEAEVIIKNLETGVDGSVASAMDIEIFRNHNEKESVTYYNSHEYDENGAPSPGVHTFGGYTTNAASAALTKDADGDIVSMQINTGSELALGDRILLRSSKRLNGMTVAFEGKNANVEIDENELDGITELKFYTPNSVNRVTVNGSNVKFAQNGDSIVITDTSPSDEQTSGGGSGGSGGGGGGSSSGGGGNAGVSVKPFPPGGIVVDNKNTDADDETDSDETDTRTVEFTDISGHWAEAEIILMFKKGIVNGVDDTLFMPDREITRAEFAVLAVRCLNLETVGYNGEFSDVYDSDWYADDLQTAFEAGLINGDGDLFRPNDSITRAELAAITARMCGDAAESRDVTFTDEDEFAQWAEPYIKRAAALGIVNGMEDGSFKADKNSTRAEAVVMLSRVAELLDNTGE